MRVSRPRSALGVVARKGNGKLRHVKVGNLWLQEKRESGEIEFHKVLGEGNPADLMTKGLADRVMRKHMDYLNQQATTGRAAEGLKL